MLKARGDQLAGKRVVVLGSGNVAIYAIEKAVTYGAKVIACSDSTGYILDEKGLDLDLIKRLKEVEYARIEKYAEEVKHAKFFKGGSIWSVPCDVALPCATQNELNAKDAEMLIKNGCIAVQKAQICLARQMPFVYSKTLKRRTVQEKRPMPVVLRLVH